MNEHDPDRQLREKLLTFARAAGAEAADAMAMRARTLDASVRRGALEDAASAESFGVGLRVFKGHRQAFGSSADASEDGLRRLAQQVCDMASVVPEDPYSHVARADEYAQDIPDADLHDRAPVPDVRTLADQARAAEDAALAVKGITNSDGAHAGRSAHIIGLSTSTGFSAAYTHSGAYLSLSVIGGIGDAMETDHASSRATFAADLEDPLAVGRRAGERTVARLGSRTGKTGHFPVIFDARVASSLLRSFSRAISGARVAKGTSFLCGLLGSAVFAPGVTIIDDPLRPRGLRSGPFDGEGLPVSRRVMVEKGVLTSWFLDLRSAARLGLRSTGHATRGLSSPSSPSPTNLWIEPGALDRDVLIAGVDEGFLVTDVMGASISLATGDYSRGASGFWISGGKIAYPVSEMTIAGNLKDMFLAMTPASDLVFREGIDAPSLRVDGMTVASR